MSADDTPLTDVRDMVGVHDAFRRGLGEARGQLAAIDDGDAARAERFGSYFDELLYLLHIHHAGEDELLYPLLVERVPDERPLFDRMEEQHAAVTAGVQAAQDATKQYRASAAAADGAALADASESLAGTLAVHLSEEEARVLPIAAVHISEAEWGALPVHAFMHYTGTRPWLLFGLASEAFPPDVRERVLAPGSPITEMWNGGGSDAFAAEMAAIRG
jgi:Hemerythrin HHE cation binding domain